ncbi:hypothetical protein GXW83_06945 [Streptacidiphilus sp. PB12-B1b]|uniref:hypothetical protein n=1 Tax=Streptacidiphilus sp. PB12-B1b TaxID=2705012 RepID=UPI0015F79C93|nr:hypothetical protein [Streptacidiphilus sp. PB12-B1b]QMU75519.1 hypothetical protein GXW83_06945 [Streptacidiphilus sp. PB12-B1b]
MTVNLPVVLVLGIVAWLVFKFFRIRWWAGLALIFFGFFLAHTFVAPAITSGTRTGVQIVNTRH